MKTGRPPEAGVSRGATVCVRLTPSELKDLDAARGKMSRSSFLRQAASTSKDSK